MTRNFDFNRFAAAIEQTASGFLGEGNPQENMVLATRAAQEMAENALAQNLEDAEPIACGPGCGHCCVVNVAVLQPEALVIVEYLEKKLSEMELSTLRQRVAELHRSIRWLDDEERLLLRQPCAFLDDQGSCSVHPVRPFLCRGMNSTDPESCREAVALHAFDESPQILLNLFQRNLFDHAFIGLARAMERAGLDSRSRKLTEAVQSLLNSPMC